MSAGARRARADRSASTAPRPWPSTSRLSFPGRSCPIRLPHRCARSSSGMSPRRWRGSSILTMGQARAWRPSGRRVICPWPLNCGSTYTLRRPRRTSSAKPSRPCSASMIFRLAATESPTSSTRPWRGPSRRRPACCILPPSPRCRVHGEFQTYGAGRGSGSDRY